MHADEVSIDVDLVRSLLHDQFPELAPDEATRPLRRVTALGTDHAVFRLGDDLSVRLPKIGWADGQGERERRWLPSLALSLPVEVPIPVVLGRPGRGYPYRWYVTRWLDGERPTDLDPAHRLAVDLAATVTALRSCETTGAPSPRPGRRGGPLAEADAATRAAAQRLHGAHDPTTDDQVDVDALIGVWAAGVGAPVWTGPPMWVHGDLSDGNLLLRDGRLSGVIDWSGLVAGDPAVDLMVAWSTFDPTARRDYLEELSRADSRSCDEATRVRGRAWAVSAAIQALPYYRDTNPDIVARSWRTIRAVLDELR